MLVQLSIEALAIWRCCECPDLNLEVKTHLKSCSASAVRKNRTMFTICSQNAEVQTEVKCLPPGIEFSGVPHGGVTIRKCSRLPLLSC